MLRLVTVALLAAASLTACSSDDAGDAGDRTVVYCGSYVPLKDSGPVSEPPCASGEPVPR